MERTGGTPDKGKVEEVQNMETGTEMNRNLPHVHVHVASIACYGMEGVLWCQKDWESLKMRLWKVKGR